MVKKPLFNLLFFLVIFGLSPKTLIAQSHENELPTPQKESVLHLIFDVFYEGLDVPIGIASYRFLRTAEGQYRLNAEMKTVGLAALFISFRQETLSEGNINKEGLQPRRFWLQRDKKPATETLFDREKNQVTMSNGDVVENIATGTQDLLSLPYQMGYWYQSARGQPIDVVVGKKYVRYEVEELGNESLDLPQGVQQGLHLRARSEDVAEVWVGIETDFLPLKVRYTDKKGRVFKQILRHKIYENE